MMSSLAAALGLLAASAGADSEPREIFPAPPSAASASAMLWQEYAPGWPTCQLSDCPAHSDPHATFDVHGAVGKDPWCWCHWWCSPCDLSHHLPYYPPAHGYYYFRPYNLANLRAQQEVVVSWGGDPRNPYSNEIFQRVYAELEAEGISLETLPDPETEQQEAEEGEAEEGDQGASADRAEGLPQPEGPGQPPADAPELPAPEDLRDKPDWKVPPTEEAGADDQPLDIGPFFEP
jgi:hypothetical protein